jgi:hypothetical protein
MEGVFNTSILQYFNSANFVEFLIHFFDKGINMTTKLTNTFEPNETNKEADLLESCVRDLTSEEFSSVAGCGNGSQDTPIGKP